MTVDGDFTVVLRGYDRAAVDSFKQRVQEALTSESQILRGTVREELRQVTFRVVLRGYDRGEVDDYLAAASGKLS